MSHAAQHPSAPLHVLIISHDVIGSRMAGPGIRYWEMARVLAAQHTVTLLAPQPIDLDTMDKTPPALRCGSYTWGDAATLAGWLQGVDVVVANGFLLQPHPELARIGQPLVLDLYDPILLENLELFRAAPAEQRMAQSAQDHDLLQRQLAAGDFFLCATERQRDLYLGALLHAGRITPARTDSDPQLRRLIDVAGFGLSATPPRKQRPALRGVIPGIAAQDVLLLWTGGLWDWLDPLTLVQAMAQVVQETPHVKLVFLAGKHPGAAHTMRMPQAARALAADLGLLDSYVFFYEQWIPYAQRADFLLEADIAVSLHRSHLETVYAAVRSRFLDHLWAGLPSIVSEGDAAAELVRSGNLGYTVAPEDAAAVAAAVQRMARDTAQRQMFAAQARQAAEAFRWQQTLAPLVQFCTAPIIAEIQQHKAQQAADDLADDLAGELNVSGDNVSTQEEHAQTVQQIEAAWQFGSAPPQGSIVSRTAQRLFGRLLAPLIAQQRDFNAASVKLFYHLLAQQQETQTYLDSAFNAVMAQTISLQKDLHARLDRIAEFTGEVSGRVDTLHKDMHARLDRIAEFTGEVSGRVDTLHKDMHGRMDSLAEFDHSINDRLERLRYTVETLNEALAAADEASATLASHLALLQPPPASRDSNAHDADATGSPDEPAAGAETAARTEAETASEPAEEEDPAESTATRSRRRRRSRQS